MDNQKIINIALPKGRLQGQIAKHVASKGVTIKEVSRKLDFVDLKNGYRFLFVKNSDVPVYVNYGVADVGIAGSDVIYEADFECMRLGVLPFGSTRICVAGHEKDRGLYEAALADGDYRNTIKIATKFLRFTADYFSARRVPIELIKLTGSVELAPILNLSQFIVDLVETGTTLKENDLMVIDEIGHTQVEVIANRSLYKLNFRKIDDFIRKLIDD